MWKVCVIEERTRSKLQGICAIFMGVRGILVSRAGITNNNEIRQSIIHQTCTTQPMQSHRFRLSTDENCNAGRNTWNTGSHSQRSGILAKAITIFIRNQITICGFNVQPYACRFTRSNIRNERKFCALTISKSNILFFLL